MRRLVVFLVVVSCRGTWGSHTESRNCVPAIEGELAWPSPPCDAMRMCANEAKLTPAQDAALRRQMSAAHCAAP